MPIPNPPPYDPMTPSVDDYHAAQRDTQRIFQENLGRRGQTNDPKTFAQGAANLAAARKKENDIKARLPKGTK